MQTKICLFFILAIFLAGCAQTDEPISISSSDENIPDTFISLEDALETVKPYLSSLDGDATRSFNRKVKNVELINNSQTRSELPSYYIVNFENNQGFAILAADKRLLPVCAFSDKGAISLQDTIQNKGLAGFISSLPDANSAPASIITGPTTNPTTYTKEVYPLLTTTVQKWGQGSPFNSYCPVNPNTGKHYYVGCVPIATCMVMSFFEYPKSYNGYQIEWKNIKADYNNVSLFKFLADLGVELDADYRPGGTGVVRSNVNPVFVKMGYKEPSFSNFREETAQSTLRSKQPIMMHGQSSSAGHAWLMDGLYKVTTKQLNPNIGGSDITVVNYYYHLVWGWNGSNNGYYASSTSGFGGNPAFNEDHEVNMPMSEYYSNLYMRYNFQIK